MKRLVMVVLCGMLVSRVWAESAESPIPWLNIQTNNCGWYWTADDKLIGYVIDDQSRSNLPAMMRQYHGELTFVFYGATGTFVMDFETIDIDVHYGENISVRAYNGDEMVLYEDYKVDDSQGKRLKVDFADAGLHRIVIRGAYSRVFTQNDVSRGCITTFSNIEWRPDVIRVCRTEGEVEMPRAWLDRYVRHEKSAASDVDYSSLALGVGKNGHTLVDSYVAGLDPDDEQSKFRTRISLVDGKPKVTWEPQLSAEEAAMRVYTVYGKKTLGPGEAWMPVTDENRAECRFFKVGVEMR